MPVNTYCLCFQSYCPVRLPSVESTQHVMSSQVPSVEYTQHVMSSKVPSVESTQHVMSSQVPSVELTKHVLINKCSLVRSQRNGIIYFVVILLERFILTKIEL